MRNRIVVKITRPTPKNVECVECNDEIRVSSTEEQTVHEWIGVALKIKKCLGLKIQNKEIVNHGVLRVYHDDECVCLLY